MADVESTYSKGQPVIDGLSDKMRVELQVLLDLAAAGRLAPLTAFWEFAERCESRLKSRQATYD